MACRSRPLSRWLWAVFYFVGLVGSATPGAAQVAHLGFEARGAADSVRPEGWSIRDGVGSVSLDTVAYEGRLSLRVIRTATGPVTVAIRSIAVDSLAGRRVRLTAWVRTRAVGNGSARLWILAQNRRQVPLVSEDMSGRGTNGDRAWTRIAVEAPLPRETAQLQFGVLLDGVGTAWFDGLELTPVPADAPVADSVRSYLEHALDLMQTRSVRRDSIDWPELRALAYALAAGAPTIPDIHSVLEIIVARLGDNHSSYRRPEAAGDASAAAMSAAGQDPLPAGGWAGENIGYVRVPAFAGGDSTRATAFADSLHHIVTRANAAGVCGWIVDLRGNTGGNMWPMLAGVGPLLGDGTAGWFVYPDGTRERWGYRDGAAVIDARPVARASAAASLRSQDLPVAVLTGPRTLSSGEAIAIAFRGRERTRSFGAATGGKSTSNTVFDLADGARLVLATAVLADRTGRRYGSAIEPDVAVPSEPGREPTPDDGVAAAAGAWLSAQPSCTREESSAAIDATSQARTTALDPTAFHLKAR